MENKGVLELLVDRTYKCDKYTIGHLYLECPVINGKVERGTRFCDTIEDPDRGLSSDMPLSVIKAKKVYGRTAIPRGRYRVVMGVQSPTYAKKPEWMAYNNAEMPRIEGVPGWSGLLIHTGNTADHTLGCLVVGSNDKPGCVLQSKATFYRLFPILLEADKQGREIYITYR